MNNLIFDPKLFYSLFTELLVYPKRWSDTIIAALGFSQVYMRQKRCVYMEAYQLLSHQMRDIKNALTGVLNRVLLRYDVSPVMMFALELLLKHPEYIAIDIASEVGVTRGAITQLLDKMEEQGLVSRHPHPTSRRSLQIRVTDQGHALANSVLNDYHEQIAKMFDVYSNDEIAVLSKLLSKLPL